MDKIEEHLQSIKWEDISIILTENNEPILILLCSNQTEADKLYFLLTNNSFLLIVHQDKKSGTHEIRIHLNHPDYAEFGVGFKTPKTLQSYPPLKFLHNKQITSITCGYYDQQNILRYNPHLHPLENKQIELN